MICCVGLSVVGIVVLLKVYTRVTMGIYKGKERLDGKTVIVTGASAGIGLESSKDFAKRGARVVMLCRDMAKGEKVRSDIIQETSNSNLTLKRVDFTDLASVRQCANEILKEETRIDVLLNNAGAASMDHEITKDGMQILMQSNHFGPFLFTNILLGMIKQSAPSRIVNVSSIAHKRAKLDLNNLNAKLREGFPSMVYSNSKLANVYFTIDLANKLKGTGVTVNSLHPGLVLTEIFRNSPSLGQIVLNMLCWIVGKNCWEGAQTQIMLCVSKSVEKVTGEYFSDCKAVSTSSAGKDKNRAALLWTLSEKAVGLRDSEKHYE